ncbi:glycosyltransferase [Shewanella sp. OMA3-2]|uniref:glycosyltransferase n=1 Tax=Shewanella sp. OMA3-2 TaxID=2908650 RepID=UPI001F3E857F|nr:glycosyltransferase [Shewanella sp. OMA3-2]UJF23144.1 glycosyltransferase [Shewanella sp. OMA3-2]
MMKVYHIITSLDVGGAETALKRLVIDTKDDYDIKIFSLTTSGKIAGELIKEGVDVYSLNIKTLRNVIKSINLLKNIFIMDKPDVIHSWLYHADLIGGIASKLAGVKNVIWGVRTTHLKKGSFSTVVIRQLLSFLSYFIPSKIVCVAEAARDFHVKIGYSRKKMIVIGNGFSCDPQKLSELEVFRERERLGITVSDIVIGSVGRFSQDKAQDLFVQAALLVAPNNPDVKFLMVGREIDINNSLLMNPIKKSGFSSKFILVGEQSDISRWFCLFDIFCLHSRTEGFPNVLGEAMSHGLCCASTKAGDAEFILSNTGVLSEHITSESIAFSINQLLILSSAQRIALGRLAKKRANDYFSIQKTTSQYNKLYKKMMVGN